MLNYFSPSVARESLAPPEKLPPIDALYRGPSLQYEQLLQKRAHKQWMANADGIFLDEAAAEGGEQSKAVGQDGKSSSHYTLAADADCGVNGNTLPLDAASAGGRASFATEIGSRRSKSMVVFNSLAAATGLEVSQVQRGSAQYLFFTPSSQP